MRSRQASEAGFSLVETLVTLAVIASMSAMLFEAISTHARAARYVAEKRSAIMLARSLLAQAMAGPGAGQLGERGQSGGMTWRFVRRSIGQGARDATVPLEEVRIDVFDAASQRQLVDVRTLRLAR
jgi:prepilin-type N-terminal cleavage/methylation domain-containing protein